MDKSTQIQKQINETTNEITRLKNQNNLLDRKMQALNGFDSKLSNEIDDWDYFNNRKRMNLEAVYTVPNVKSIMPHIHRMDDEMNDGYFRTRNQIWDILTRVEEEKNRLRNQMGEINYRISSLNSRKNALHIEYQKSLKERQKDVG